MENADSPNGKSIPEIIKDLGFIINDALDKSNEILKLEMFDFEPQIFDDNYDSSYNTYQEFLKFLPHLKKEESEQLERVLCKFSFYLNNITELCVSAELKGRP